MLHVSDRTTVHMNLSNKTKTIIIAMDSFKGSLTSVQAGNAVAEGIKRVYPKSEVIVLPMSDGGDGMLETCMQIIKGGKIIHAQVHNPLNEISKAYYAISADGKKAYIEMAIASGLTLIPETKRNPMDTTSYGTGELICDALDKGCRHFFIGLGGSATNDAGLGMLQALGFRFYNHPKKSDKRYEIRIDAAINGRSLMQIERIDTSAIHPALHEAQFTIACDVSSPFYGPQGAAYVFAPQKGANAQMVQQLDQGLQHVAQVIYNHTGKDISHVPGAGAAGGMGGSLIAFLNAQLISGTQFMLTLLDFREKIKNADFIITGEGKSDSQTLMGKIPYGILHEALQLRIPVILLSGGIEDIVQLNSAGFSAVFSATPFPLTLQQAMLPQTAYANIANASEQIGRLIAL